MSSKAKPEEEVDSAEEEEPVEMEDIKFGKDTLDAVILATYNLSVCGINWSDIIAFGTAYPLHFFSMFMKFLIVFLFKVYTIDNQATAYTATSATKLSGIMAEMATNASAVSLANQTWVETECAGKNHHSYIHVLMLFVWFSFLVPELLKLEQKLWALYALDTESPDQPEVEGATCMALKPKKKEKTDTTSLTLDKNGAKCVTKPPADGAKKEKTPQAWGKNCLADYHKPEEDKKVGITITCMSLCCKVSTISLYVIPDALVLMYITWIGIHFIVFEIDISSLIFKALILKGVLKLPATILKTFGGKYLCKYTESSVFSVVKIDLVPGPMRDMWAIWICPCLKFIVASSLTLIFYFGVFGYVRELRHLCSVALGQGGSLGQDVGGYTNKAGLSACAVNKTAMPDNTCNSYMPAFGSFPFVPPMGSIFRSP